MMKKISRYLFLCLSFMLVLSAARCSRGGTGTGDGDPFVIEDKEEIVLEYTRLYDDSDVLDELIASYQDDHPNIEIVVRKYDFKTDETIYEYQKEMTKLIADGNGPDMFMIHNDWLPYYKNQLTPMPTSLMTASNFADDYPDVVVDDFIDSNKVYAVPYYIDNLILFYNTEIFRDLRLKPPTTWSEFVDLVPKLTKYGTGNEITQSAVPLGVADGIPRFAEILATLIMQYGGEMTNADHTKATFNLPAPDSDPPYFSGQEALTFYTNFANPNKETYTYNDYVDSKGERELPTDIQAFMDGTAAMYIGYSYHVAHIDKFAPNLRFDTAPLPQLRLTDPVVVANYWGETVSKTCEHPNEAWDFINYVSQKSNVARYTRAAGHVPARLDKQESYISKRYYGAVAQQINFSKSWYRSNTSKIEDIFATMVENVLKYNVTPATAIDTAVRDINELD